ncbi:hypothetical protein N825_11425 [Skermanella stibiiresistens SB22]|uniref:Alpha/beta hydrolase n=1 Tax=Skermanella stibiiresistens SB22 TaxID=1385369 RepID=W9H235_9PROT|nr:alpha/beta hydrolase [Skermanella stibiiresistens]EWY38772.1 hypothetical protein N825_11425 [Skermanella stibiiresistens SB22]
MEDQHSAPVTVLILPGLGGSGPQHWQSLWQDAEPSFQRVEQADWDNPDRAAWIANLETAARAAEGPIVLVAHSLACPLVALWAKHGTVAAVRGAMLVAPPDLDSADRVPVEAAGFGPMPLDPLPFPSVVVASSDDPYAELGRTRAFASGWGSEFIDIGPCGHINTESGFGDWPRGLEILAGLIGK